MALRSCFNLNSEDHSRGHSLKWPIPGGSAFKESLLQASGMFEWRTRGVPYPKLKNAAGCLVLQWVLSSFT